MTSIGLGQPPKPVFFVEVIVLYIWMPLALVLVLRNMTDPPVVDLRVGVRSNSSPVLR